MNQPLAVSCISLFENNCDIVSILFPYFFHNRKIYSGFKISPKVAPFIGAVSPDHPSPEGVRAFFCLQQFGMAYVFFEC